MTTSLALLFTVLWVGAARAAPAMWVVHTKNCTAYLLGTVHIMKSNSQWMDSRIQFALDSSQELWLEAAANTPYQPPNKIPPTRPHDNIFDPDYHLSAHLTRSELEKLDDIAKEMGISSMDQLDNYKPYYLVILLQYYQYKKAGYDSSQGVDFVLERAAIRLGKRVFGFETDDQQDNLLNDIAGSSEDEQMASLRKFLSEFDTNLASASKMLDSWQSGDVQEMVRAQLENRKGVDPIAYRRLRDDRNAVFAKQIYKRMKSPGTIFVAVGANHLIGPQSVIEMLKNDGISARRY